VGEIKNASVDVALNVSFEPLQVNICVYATRKFEDALIRLLHKNEIIYEGKAIISPTDIFTKTVVVPFENRWKKLSKNFRSQPKRLRRPRK